MRAATFVAISESPPRSKKSATMLGESTSSSWEKTSAMICSVGFRGATCPAAGARSGSARARRSILPCPFMGNWLTAA